MGSLSQKEIIVQGGAKKSTESKPLPFLNDATDLGDLRLIRKVYKKDFIKHTAVTHKNK